MNKTVLCPGKIPVLSWEKLYPCLKTPLHFPEKTEEKILGQVPNMQKSAVHPRPDSIPLYRVAYFFCKVPNTQSSATHPNFRPNSYPY